MSQAAKANEPSMEEILASIRKIISDDDTAKPAAAAPAAKAPPAPTPAAEPAPQSQDDIDALMASFDTVEEEPPPPPPPPPVKAKAPPPPPPKEPEPDIFELTEAVSVPLPAVNDDLDFAEPVEEPPKPVAKARPKPAPAPEPEWDEEPPLMSGDATKAVGAAFSSLGALTLSHGGTLDGLVREMLRPMLKLWLDEQLPPLVEKLVKAEIERATRGGR